MAYPAGSARRGLLLLLLLFLSVASIAAASPTAADLSRSELEAALSAAAARPLRMAHSRLHAQALAATGADAGDLGRATSASTASTAAAAAPYETRYINMTLDHFNSFSQPKTYRMRYLWDDSSWGTKPISSACKGPVFFYTGNEGDITLFYNNTGFLTQTLGPQFGALVIFAEHRYYGESLPFGNKSFDGTNAGYLTVEQALADYAQLLGFLKATTANMAACPVIAFGGSYGGMLAAWMRLKYPNVIQGSLAASAPVAQFYGTSVNPSAFYQIATEDFTNVSKSCSRTIEEAFDSLVVYGLTKSGRSKIQEELNLCAPLDGVEDLALLYQWMNAGFTYMAMTDYPYPADFLQPMPGWPVTVACGRIADAAAARSSALAAAREGVAVYYNSTGQAGDCFDISQSISNDLGDEAWGYQACTEMVMPISSNGVTDMFLPVPYELKPYGRYCQEQYGVLPRPLWANLHFGGKNIDAGSNIVFSNGQLDPWRAGGILESSGSLVAIIIEDGAHHLDLRTPNPKDPQSVVDARNTEIKNIQQWIDEYQS